MKLLCTFSVLLSMVQLSAMRSHFIPRSHVCTLQKPQRETFKPNFSAKLPAIAYQQKADAVMKATLALGKGYPEDMSEFCQRRIQDAHDLTAGACDIESTLKILDPRMSGCNRDLLMNLVVFVPAVRFLQSFTHHNFELVIHRANRILKSYRDELADFEKEYSDELEKVNEDIYQTRFEMIPVEKRHHIVIFEAGKLARVIQKLRENASIKDLSKRN